MSELGRVLQSARQEKGISLDDIQTMTKIQRRYLEAIERGHFHMLPGHFYARAFIKSYAEAVGLDASQVLSHYQSDLPAQQPQEQVERLRRRRAAAAKPSLSAGRWVTQTLLVCFVLLVVGVIYMYVVNRDSAGDNPLPGNSQSIPGGVEQDTNHTYTPAPTQPSNENNAVVPTPTTPVVEKQAVLQLAQQKDKNYDYTLSNVDKIVLTFKFKGECWIEVREQAGGKVLEQGKFKEGEKSVELANTAYINLGNKRGVDIYVNDLPMDMEEIKHVPALVNITLEKAE